MKHLPKEISENLLQIALRSHMVALKCDPEQTDLLFNTGQILTSVAEEAKSDENDFKALELYREALVYFETCLNKQEKQMEDFQRMISASTSLVSHVSEDFPKQVELETQEVWTSIEETVSPVTLYETVLEIENLLSAICTLRCPFDEGTFVWVKSVHEQVVQERLDKYAGQAHQEAEAINRLAWFQFTFSDCAFRNGYIDLADFEREYTASFRRVRETTETEQPDSGILIQIEAQIQMGQTLRGKILTNLSSRKTEAKDLLGFQKSAWIHISLALDSLSTVCRGQLGQKASSTSTALHLHRGDCELARRWLGQTAQPYSVAKSSAATLSRNAKVYYRGAKEFAKRAGDEEDIEVTLIKEAVAGHLIEENDRSLIQEIDTCDASTWQDVIGEMTRSLLLLDADVMGLEGKVQENG